MRRADLAFFAFGELVKSGLQDMTDVTGILS